ncbi:tumor susceptibility gene protein [Echria macrotheca]|uniref:Tumor susceptibility gene protein n=1 Tax=Echria macrotheca TaxID=438768 RepID=A0AAJ0B5Z5_9PEZI|nr:tumor susceptibility gene protein [Echria macrotheca]
MVVPQHVLNWLYSVLTSEYHDVNRTYNDVAQALSGYPSLKPRTDVHTFPNGTSALLLHLSGTIPVVFRGTTYRFPVSIWVPHAYPREAPIVYVTPTENMMVRPGQHVDPQGLVYHPYLAGWPTFWDKSTILDFLAILRDIFAKEPPVIARQPGRPVSVQPSQTPPPVPPLPPNLTQTPSVDARPPPPQESPKPPPPPPKPGAPVELQTQPVTPASHHGGPPLPPLPPGAGRSADPYGPADPFGPDMTRPPPEQPRPSRYETAPPLPQAHPQSPPQPRPQFAPSGPGQPLPQHGPPYAGPPPPIQQAGPSRQPQPPFPPHNPRQAPPGFMQSQPAYGTPPPPWQQPQQIGMPMPPATAQAQPKPPPPPDLLDEDLSLTIPSPSTVPAPPIPPNPEKDALLHQLARTLFDLRQRARTQNETSLAGLAAQRTAMLAAAQRIQAESAQLTQLSALLTSNTAVLQESLRRADGVIESSARQTEPDIDELLVAPTVVGNQLYELVAEERALADAIFVLGRAVERGRIAPGTFARMTRSLAREWYLKKALVKKIGVGCCNPQRGVTATGTPPSPALSSRDIRCPEASTSSSSLFSPRLWTDDEIVPVLLVRLSFSLREMACAAAAAARRLQLARLKGMPLAMVVWLWL